VKISVVVYFSISTDTLHAREIELDLSSGNTAFATAVAEHVQFGIAKWFDKSF